MTMQERIDAIRALTELLKDVSSAWCIPLIHSQELRKKIEDKLTSLISGL